MKPYLEKITRGEDLTITEMEQATRLMFDQSTDPAAVGGFLIGLKQKKEAVSELTGLVNVIREQAVLLPEALPKATDNCGTGGDGSMSFNISTTSAFVVAGAGITVSKHGNRSISSKTGSADVLEALGVNINLSPEETYQLLKLNDIAFLFAQNVHPKMKQVTGIRRALGIPTIFNLIGPLTNPVELTTQLVGIYRRDLLMEMAATLHQLGRKRAVVINGPDYMDEAALHGDTHGVLVEGGELLPFTLSPTDVGLNYVDASEIKGGDALENAEILKRVLEGEPGPHRDTVLLNAALAIFADGTAQTVKEGVALAKESIDQGHALKKLETMIAYSKEQEVAK